MIPPTAQQVTARLRLAAELSRGATPTHGIDYSRDAVTARLRELAEVSKLCAQLVAIGAAARRARRDETARGTR